MTKPDSALLTSIQWLRAVAAILVALYHTSQGVEFRTGHLTSHWTDFGACGVDIFFVISGFIMTVSTQGRPFRAPDFLLRRLIRILPVYWVFTLLKAASLLLIPSLVLFSVFSTPNFVASMLLVPYDIPGQGLRPLIIVAWSLELELFFYLIFALSRAADPRHWTRLLALTFAALIGIYAVGTTSPVIDFYARPIILEFLLGIGIAHLFLAGRLPTRPVGLALLVLGTALLATLPEGTETTRPLLWGLPAAGLVLGALAVEHHVGVRRLPWLTFIGDSSYSLYLTHTLAVPFLMLPLKFWHPGLTGSLLFLIPACIAQVAIGCIAYVLLERPLTGALSRRYKSWTGKRTAAAAPGIAL